MRNPDIIVDSVPFKSKSCAICVLFCSCTLFLNKVEAPVITVIEGLIGIVKIPGIL